MIDIKKLLNDSTLIKLITTFVIKTNLLFQFRNCTIKLSKFQNTKSSIFKQTLIEFFEIIDFDSTFSKYNLWLNFEWMLKNETMKINFHTHIVIDAIENVKVFDTSFSFAKWLKKFKLKLHQKIKRWFSNISNIVINDKNKQRQKHEKKLKNHYYQFSRKRLSE